MRIGLVIGGLAFVIFGIWLILKILNGKNTDDKKRKERAAMCSLFPMVGAILVLASFAPIAAETVTETVLDDIVVVGVDEDTLPLSAYDLKLVKEEQKQGSEIVNCTYTVIATLKKNSETPIEGYFEFSIVLVDESGAYIEKQEVCTMPTPFLGNENGDLLTLGDTSHFEKEIYSSSTRTPVKIGFVNVKEFSKADFIQNTLDAAKENMDMQYYGDAKRYAEIILKYEPDNEAAKTLLEEATGKEKETAEPGEAAESTPLVEDEISEFDKAVSENPNAVILSDGFLGPNILWNVEILEISEDINQVESYVERHHENAVSLIESGSKAGYTSVYVKCRATLIQSFTGLPYKFNPDDFEFFDSNDKLDTMIIAQNGFEEKIAIGDYTTGGFVVQVQTDEIPGIFLGDKELDYSE